ncbi:MAG TPA: discoidin domain-containing protein [Candidatus Acidoferrum sp.]|nr:discoidin domain-containing protein [Candidatus Acidoferrum sp.]
MKKLAIILACVAGIFVLEVSSAGQTISVDISHPSNHFVPKETLGAGVDRIAVDAIDKDLLQPTLEKTLASGWQPVTYRQNTELAVEAWHWNPQGTWSNGSDGNDAGGKGYFTGSATPTEVLRYSYGYGLPRRGFTRNDGTDNVGFSRLTDGDLNTFWKSNPYLTQRFTGESDALHPQWVVVDLAQVQAVNSIRIAWGEPYARRYVVQYWTGDDPIHAPTRGAWQAFSQGTLTDGKGRTETIRLSGGPVPVRFVRIWMSESSNTCNADGSTDPKLNDPKLNDPRNCVGYAIRELFLGMSSEDGALHDILRHTSDQEQTTTYCSSVDPWHQPSDLGSTKQAQMGFDLFFTSGVTRGLPAMVPVAMLYDTPDNAAAEIAYLKKRGYPISYVEMGEEADGQYMLPEDYAALYVQWATAIHRVDPALKLGGPSFQGVNRDIEVWPDANGKVSWTARFIDYLKQHGRMNDLAFFSFEHYPYDPCKTPWGVLYDEPELVSHIMQVWHEDGVPADMPMFITEGNLSSGASETYQDIFAGVWLADYIGSFLNSGGKGVYFFHYLPLQMEPGCNSSPGTFGMFTVDANYQIQQPLAQFFVAQLINLEWAQSDGGDHQVFAAKSDVQDGAGHELVTAYAVKRPDGKWAVMAVNRDQQNAHRVRIAFDGKPETRSSFAGPVETSTFGSAQYQWHPGQTRFMAHAENGGERTIVATTRGTADPDGPIVHTKLTAEKGTMFDLPAASVVVIRGSVGGMK